MRCEIITTGSELLLGQIVNTNSAWLAQKLNALGFDVIFQTTVGDNRQRMKEVLQLALSRVDIVITTGGLGPTLGDITKEISAEVFGRKLILNDECVKELEEKFKKFHPNRVMTQNNLRQANIPEGAVILKNFNGTAPGIVLEENQKCIVNLPGPPLEMKDMFLKSLQPFLQKKFSLHAVIFSKVFYTFGIGESSLDEILKPLLLKQSNPTIALLVRKTGVLIRLTAKAETQAAAEKLFAPIETELQNLVGKFIFGIDNENLEEIIGKILLEKNLTLSVAESCTGGLLASRLTDVAGSSQYFFGGVVSYTNEIKTNVLYVSQEILKNFGAVSNQAALAMAEGVRHKFQTDLAIAITGVAGAPSEGKPTGQVHIAITSNECSFAKKYHLAKVNNTRQQIKFSATQTALYELMQFLKA